MNITHILIILVLMVSVFVIPSKLIKNFNNTSFEPIPYDELMDIVDTTIEREFTFLYTLKYKLKDIRIIPDYEMELTDLTKQVLLSFGDNLYKNLEYYHNREYIYRYVSKKNNILLIELTNKIKVTSK